MNFYQSTPFSGYRENLILTALVDIDHLKRLSLASRSLSRALSPFEEPEGFLSLVNQLAYSAIARVGPEFIAKSIQEELEDMPISTEELDALLKRPIGSVLQMLYSQ
ncbi:MULTISPECIES: hypothetical protein [Pseudomonas]|uniref:hypothetical protein n=1 Tax=Pseudomonas TaxID=286 RepID=UPI00234DA1F1|nr:hypothetical protein [Pseudomonas sp. BLCC-B112]MDC7817463.1 hypothetical protein [Pseudomonas sp. BLCC-B112]